MMRLQHWRGRERKRAINSDRKDGRGAVGRGITRSRIRPTMLQKAVLLLLKSGPSVKPKSVSPSVLTSEPCLAFSACRTTLCYSLHAPCQRHDAGR